MGIWSTGKKKPIGSEGAIAKHNALIHQRDKNTHAEKYRNFEDFFNEQREAFPDRATALEHYNNYHQKHR